MYVSPWMQALLLPRKWDVCGVICSPLTLWQVYVLRSSGNAYFCSIIDSAPSMDSASEVLLYSDLDVVSGRRLYIDELYRDKIRNRIYKRLRRQEWGKVDSAVYEYVSECTRTPGHKEKAADPKAPKSRKVAAPLEWVLAEYVAGGDASRLDEAWNTPYSIAICMFDASRDVSGDDESLISEEDEERIDTKLEKMREE